MATWSLSPQYKKSAIEKMFFFKDGNVITIEQGFRWATFKVESDERPLTDEELKNEDWYELGSIANDESWEMWDMVDGCWCNISGDDDISEEDLVQFELAWEENGYEGVEELGWSQDECEYYYTGPLELTNEDTGEVFRGESADNISIGGNPIETHQGDIEWEGLGGEPAMTDWFPVSINPVRSGTYQITSTEYPNWPFPSYAHWNGNHWDNGHVATWRGFAEDPNEM